MARVVSQRMSLLYPLIVVIILCLIFATVTVLSYLKNDKLSKQLEKNTDTSSKLASNQDLNDSSVEQMLKWHDNPPSGEPRGKTVVRRYQSQIGELTRLITGLQDKPAKPAAKEAQTALNKIEGHRGLVPELLSSHDTIESLESQLSDRDKLLQGKDAELESKNQAIAAITKQLEDQIASLGGKVKGLDEKYQTQQDTYRKDLDAAQQQWDVQRDTRDKDISSKISSIQTLKREKTALEDRISRLEEEIEEKGEDVQLGRQPDGKILRIFPTSNICYINLGANDRVKPGLTFTIYPPTGIPEDGQGKAKLIVTTTMADTSECRIQEQSERDPVAIDDLVASLTYSPTRAYTFVVTGYFDLYGLGRATSEGAAAVRAMIKYSGGKLVEDLSVQTDFVIAGERPIKPSSLAADAKPQMRQTYTEQIKVFDRYDKVISQAQSMRIPVLDTDRFLAFVGYVPTAMEP